MSEVAQGPGWWLASDGKWYPPELFPRDTSPRIDTGTTRGDVQSSASKPSTGGSLHEDRDPIHASLQSTARAPLGSEGKRSVQPLSIQLLRLAELRSSWLLTETEFLRLKARLLGP